MTTDESRLEVCVLEMIWLAMAKVLDSLHVVDSIVNGNEIPIPQ